MILRRYTFCFSSLIAANLLIQNEIACAQLIGNRSVGAPLSSPSQQRVPGIPMAPSQGAVQVNAGGIGQASNAIGSLGNRMQIDNTRFVRGNRSRQDFVGSNRTDLSGFVGAGQALGVGRVPSATDSLRIETSKAKINRPLPLQPAKGMYYPRLEFDFEKASLQEELLRESPAGKEASDRVAQFSAGSANVTMSGSTAILRGTINSVRTSELLEQLLSFEPGIDRVKNELVVQ